jgi:hypothetical protein
LCPPRLDRIWHHLGPLYRRHGIKGTSWKVKSGRAREKNARARRSVGGTEKKTPVRGGGEKGLPSIGRREGKTSRYASAVCTGWSHHACRPPLRLCILLCSSAMRLPLLLCSAPTSSLLCTLPCCCAPSLSPCCQVLKARGDPDCSLPGIALCLCAQRLMLNVIFVKD